MNSRLFSVISTAALVMSTMAHAATISEVGDAGQTVATVQNIGGNVDVIQGSINPLFDADLYRVFFNFTGTLTVRVFDTSGTFWDPNLLIFNGAGNPIAGDDDGNGTGPGLLDSRLDIAITPGFYYIAVGSNNTYSFDAGPNTIMGNDDGFNPTNPLGILDSIGGGNTGTGTYDLTFSALSESTDIPEPSTFAMLGGMLTALAVGKFLRRN